MTTTVNFYEGSYQFDSVKTELNVTEDYIKYRLARQFEYREPKEPLWATISQLDEEIARYEFDNETGLKTITFNK